MEKIWTRDSADMKHNVGTVCERNWNEAQCWNWLWATLKWSTVLTLPASDIEMKHSVGTVYERHWNEAQCWNWLRATLKWSTVLELLWTTLKWSTVLELAASKTEMKHSVGTGCERHWNEAQCWNWLRATLKWSTVLELAVSETEMKHSVGTGCERLWNGRNVHVKKTYVDGWNIFKNNHICIYKRTQK
jgi:hypothetical protein